MVLSGLSYIENDERSDTMAKKKLKTVESETRKLHERRGWLQIYD